MDIVEYAPNTKIILPVSLSEKPLDASSLINISNNTWIEYAPNFEKKYYSRSLSLLYHSQLQLSSFERWTGFWAYFIRHCRPLC